MNITDAAHMTHTTHVAHAPVHDHPRGGESLAPRVEMSAAGLHNKINPDNDTHHLSLKETVKAAASAVTVTVEDAQPLVCIGCGAVRNTDGEMPCDH